MFEDYFALQLAFAQQYAAAAQVSWASAIARCTNLRRRLNLQGPSGERAWSSLLRLASEEGASFASVLHRCQVLHAEGRAPCPSPAPFGCFSYDAPDGAGVVRIHFMPPANQSSSPLGAHNASQRLDELQRMFVHIGQTEPRARSERGVSWLYNLQAYTRLFPRDFTASVAAPAFPVHLQGSSTWGQVLNWRQAVKPAVRDAVVRALPSMLPHAPWKVFPLQALTAACPIDAFHERFGK